MFVEASKFPVDRSAKRLALSQTLNRALDRLARVKLHKGSWSAFHVCGYTGLVLSLLLSLILVTRAGLSPGVFMVVALAAVATFLALAMSIKIITGYEKITCYHHEIVVLIVAAALLRFLQQPVLAYLDVTVLGIGLFQACGRVGCLMVGCCHGRPHSFGVCYKQEHRAAGFTPYYVGVRLFPVQALESLWLLCVVSAGVALVWRGSAPEGTALSWFVIAYALGRFVFEFMRGDAERSFLYGFSEAQWTSLFLVYATLCAGLAGLLTFQKWHFGAALSLSLMMIAIALGRQWRKTNRHKLLHPRHVREVAEAIKQPTLLANSDESDHTRSPRAAEIHTASTSLGIRISASETESSVGSVRHYAFSCTNSRMNEETAEILAGLILKLKHLDGQPRLVKGNQDVFHLLVNPLESERN